MLFFAHFDDFHHALCFGYDSHTPLCRPSLEE
jgi:hypothetical protein